MKTVNAALSVVVTSLMSLLIRLVSLAVLARLLAPEQFGVVAFSIAVVSMLSLVAQLDIRDALIQAKTISAAHIRLAWQLMICMSILAYGCLFAMADRIEMWTEIHQVASTLRLIGLLLFLDLVLVPIEALLIRRGGVRTVAHSQTFGYAIGFTGIGIIAALINPSAVSLALAYLGLASVKLIICAIALTKLSAKAGEDPLSDAPDGGKPAVLREILRFSVFGTANRFFTTSAKQVDNIVVGAVLGDRLLGFYSRAYTLSATPMDTILGLTIRSVIFPSLAKMQDDARRFAQATLNANATGALLLLPLALGLSILAPELIWVMLGPGWELSVFPFQCLAIGMGLRFGPRLTAAVGRALGKQKQLFVVNFGMTLALILCVWVGATYYGINGAAAGVVVASIAQWLATLALTARLAQISLGRLFGVLIRPAAFSLFLCIPAWGIAESLRTTVNIPLVTILATIVSAAVLSVGLSVCFPKVFLGDFQRGLVGQILGKLIPAGPLRRWIKARLKAEAN